MKKNLFYLSMLAIASITVSCSNDFEEGQTPAVNNSGHAIKFDSWANKQLRAAATKAEDVTDFAVLVTDTTTVPPAADPVLIDGKVVTGSNSAGWTYTPLAFWPETAEVNFFAFSPTAAVGIDKGATELVGQNDAPTVAGDPPTPVTIKYELPTTLTDQVDLLVSRHSGTYAAEGATGVTLNFRHALSRVLFQIKSESSMDFIVSSIKLKNLKSKATLDLNDVPKDTDLFPYPTDNATIASDGYQVHWVPDGASPIIELDANLSDTLVVGGGSWTNVVADADALYVVPQENSEISTLLKTVEITTAPALAPATQFYIEITYKEKGAGATNRTYAVPVPAIVGDAYASSIAFEMERQYTFQFELFGRKPIEFKGVTVSKYNEVTQEEPLRLHWAGSNIYYDATLKHLTFADYNDKSKEQYQGVYFQWGSLIGITPVGPYSATNTVTYQKGVEAAAADAPAWNAIPHVTAPATPYGRVENYLTEIAHDPGNDIGDICKYLTELGYAPAGKRWRMPTSAEFGEASDYGNVGATPWPAVTSVNADGTDLFANGKQLRKLNTPFFPASGYRYYSSGALNGVGQYGYAWSSSPSSATGGFGLAFDSSAAYPAFYNYRTYGFPVRCVAE
ncbi:hypothetical protein FACS18947_2470 [Bacteroidia bacterium]|nr:hypothetical protein FACS18947_2470 [Bacteroidia bacterium]